MCHALPEPGRPLASCALSTQQMERTVWPCQVRAVKLQRWSGLSKALQAKAEAVPVPKPARSVPEASVDARRALRILLDRRREREISADDMSRITVTMPVPKPGAAGEEPLVLMDDANFPGGIRQVFRELRPSVEALLDGRELEFCGMLEAEADGLGVFKAEPDLCAVTLVGDINVAPFLRLLKGEFGSSPLTGIVIAINPWWTQSSAIGNPWQVGLRRDAARLLDDGGWKPLYHLEAVSSKSNLVEGFLLFCYPYPQWMVYDIAGRLLGEFDNKPARVKILDLLLANK